MNQIPNGLPTLSAGAHNPSDGQACVMEYVALLAGESWTDSPACTHPVLAKAAQNVNDRLPDAERFRLVPLIGRLFGTTAPVDDMEARVLAVNLAVWCARRVLPLVRPVDRDVCEKAIVAAEVWAAEASTSYATAYAAAAAANAAANAAAYAANAANAYAADRLVEYLTDLIDEYDRLTGRTLHRQVTTGELTELADRVSA